MRRAALQRPWAMPTIAFAATTPTTAATLALLFEVLCGHTMWTLHHGLSNQFERVQAAIGPNLQPK